MNTFSLVLLWLLAAAVIACGGWIIYRLLSRRLNQRHQMIRRHLLEDALKLIFNLQKTGQKADKYRLAVELNINLHTAQDLVVQLENQELVNDDLGNLTLTEEGRRYALQVIRAHRLWERYLADEARVPLGRIHAAANKREHRMDVDEVNRLDASLGYPVFDPHGDPIPSASGRMRDTSESTLLTELKPGQRGRIVHLEDEPPLAFAQLLAEGLYVGQEVVLEEKDQNRIVLSGEDEQYTLANSIAGNVYVSLVEPETTAAPGGIPLSELPHNVRAEVVEIDARCQGFTRRRFLDLGLTPGTVVTPELPNAFKDPRGYRLRGTLIALRNDQAQLIRVKPVTIFNGGKE